MAENVKTEIANGIARITFARPEKLNALDVETGEAFEEAVATVLAEPGVRVILMMGQGRSFMAGGDLSAFHASQDPAGVAGQVIDPVHRALKALAASPAIVVVAAHGNVAGAGMSLLLGADMAICTESATFNMAYARIAVSPDCGGTWALPRLIGMRRATQLVLTGETLTAPKAFEMGMVNLVTADDSLEREADALAGRLARGSLRAQGRIKALLRASLHSDYATQLDAEREAFLHCATGDDFREGLAAFFEKRKPDYRGA